MIQKLLRLPVEASAHAGEIDRLIFYVHILMVVLFVGWITFFIFALLRFRRSKHPGANYYGVQGSATSYVEMSVAAIELLLLFGFSIPFWYKKVNAFPPEGEAVHVRVVAQQFAWNIHYPGADGKFGRTNISLIDEQVNPIGLDRSDPAAQDDIVTINQLHLPVDKPVIVHLTTKDVIHSFALVEMRVKQDTIPGMSIPIWFVPTRTGNYEIACAQLCGLGHYRMRGFLTVHEQENFDAWLAREAAKLKKAPTHDLWD
jgi:cytochrome c oxidase subunit 2